MKEHTETSVGVSYSNREWLNRMRINVGVRSVNHVLTKIKKVVRKFKLEDEIKNI